MAAPSQCAVSVIAMVALATAFVGRSNSMKTGKDMVRAVVSVAVLPELFSAISRQDNTLLVPSE